MLFDLTRFWYTPSLRFITALLLPFSWLFGACVFIRRFLYRIHVLKTKYFPVPIIVVGNITVGGTGKTPLVMWLAHFLKTQKYHPGIVSRGVGGIKHHYPHEVLSTDSTQTVGDEALMLLLHTQCPVVIGLDRAEAVRYLLKHTDCNIVISDDGLQHYRLGRDVEIAVLDGDRRLGNQCLLPAGPLREPATRLKQVDMVIENGASQDSFAMQLEPLHFVSVADDKSTCALNTFVQSKVHAVAGIGNPERFFQTLRTIGFDIIPHIYPDHHHYQAQDLDFDDTYPILMTEKDAVKCRLFADKRCWYLKIDVNINNIIQEKLLSLIKKANENKS